MALTEVKIGSSRLLKLADVVDNSDGSAINDATVTVNILKLDESAQSGPYTCTSVGGTNTYHGLYPIADTASLTDNTMYIARYKAVKDNNVYIEDVMFRAR